MANQRNSVDRNSLPSLATVQEYIHVQNNPEEYNRHERRRADAIVRTTRRKLRKLGRRYL